jgi:hypothetical protein
MPLMPGKSRNAFSHNVATEMDAGKPQNQALAIAYAMKRKRKGYGGMMAEGGDVPDDDEVSEIVDKAFQNYTQKRFADRQSQADYDRSEAKYQAQLDKRHQRVAQRKITEPTINEPYYRDPSIGISQAGQHIRHALESKTPSGATEHKDYARQYHMQTLVNMVGQRGKDRSNLAEGGMVCDDDDDMIERIMRKKYSEGGRVANETPWTADFEPNEFDELVKDDDLEGHYPGSQEIGDEQEDMDRHDIVSRIMRSRAKRPGHNPRPA